jgi:biotin operon repressor
MDGEYRSRAVETASLTADQILDLLHRFKPEWHAQAACRGQLDLMFPAPTRGTMPNYTKALAMCRRCPVIDKCKTAGRDEEHGVWGGIVMQRTHREDPFIRLLADDRWWTGSEVALALGMSERNALRRLARLVEQGRLVRAGINGTGRYRFRLRRETDGGTVGDGTG